jgi:hypothetical protein
MFAISNSRRVLNGVFFLLGDILSSEFYVKTFRNRQSVQKRRHIKFRRRGFTQNKEYNVRYIRLLTVADNISLITINNVILLYIRYIVLLIDTLCSCWTSIINLPNCTVSIILFCKGSSGTDHSRLAVGVDSNRMS